MMVRCDDHAYYTRRAAEEMDNGDQAASAAIAAIHYDLAHRYSLIAFTKNNGKLALIASNSDQLAA